MSSSGDKLADMPSLLLTGAARGIGRATALRLAAAGWDVYAGVRNAADGETLAADAPSGAITPIVLDVTDAAQLATLDELLPQRLNAVVNNAGIVVGGPLEAVALDELRRQFEVNVVGPVAVTQAVLPRLRAARGRIVFVSSVGGRVVSPLLGPYSASKYAIEAVADTLRLELRQWGVKVSLIEPGAIETDMWRNALATADETEAALSAEHRELYDRHLSGIRATITRVSKQTSPADKVAAAIERALTSSRPRARYVVGIDARVQLALSALPTPASDAAFAKLTGMPSA
jgi:NAD(P)-dependent dehydrogenase (short-subunit alcohol dehydrogenase family)